MYFLSSKNSFWVHLLLRCSSKFTPKTPWYTTHLSTISLNGIFIFPPDFMAKVQEKIDLLPTTEDLEGSAQALLRLQDTYSLPTEKMARGELQGLKESATLTGLYHN